MKESVVHSHISGRDIKPLVLTDLTNFAVEDLARVGIAMDSRNIEKMIEGIGMDSIQNPITAPSIPSPVQFLQTWLTGFVKVATASRKIDEITGVTVIGSWEDEQVIQGILENLGTAQPYGDYTNVPFASWNDAYITRTVVRFEEGLRVGALEEARTARMRINSAATKRESAQLALDIQRNLIGFNGYNTGTNLTYGFLNDPNLPAYITVAAGASTSTLWSTKTFLEITADIRTAIIQVRVQSQDTIDPEKVNQTLVLPTDAVDYLSVTSTFGNSVRDWLTKTYPRVRVVSAPQLNLANGGSNVFYLFADNISESGSDDGSTFTQIVPARFKLVGVAQGVKYYEEDYSNACAGVLLKRPFAIARYTGI